MLVSSFDLPKSFNYTPYLFYKNGSNQRSILSVYGPSPIVECLLYSRVNSITEAESYNIRPGLRTSQLEEMRCVGMHDGSLEGRLVKTAQLRAKQLLLYISGTITVVMNSIVI
jgi:hypothetical protein